MVNKNQKVLNFIFQMNIIKKLKFFFLKKRKRNTIKVKVLKKIINSYEKNIKVYLEIDIKILKKSKD